MSVNFPVFGSYMEGWRLERSTGKIFAEGCSAPSPQNARSTGPRTREVNQTLPFSSNIGLCGLVWLSQIGSAPQYADGAIGLFFVEGVFGSRTGTFISLAVCRTGSRTGMKSVLSSVAP